MADYLVPAPDKAATSVSHGLSLSTPSQTGEVEIADHRYITAGRLAEMLGVRRGKQGERRASIWMRKCRRMRDGRRA